MGFWEDLFERPKRPEKKIVDLNVNHRNAIWLLNEELKRMHEMMLNTRMHSDNNIKIFWAKIEALQVKMYELLDKTPDIDTQKQINEIQNRIIEETILGEEQK